jgi:hypothetical protein
MAAGKAFNVKTNATAQEVGKAGMPPLFPAHNPFVVKVH